MNLSFIRVIDFLYKVYFTVAVTAVLFLGIILVQSYWTHNVINAQASVFDTDIVPLDPTSASQDMFLKVDGVPGESADAQHKDQIDVQSWSFGAENSRGGKATFQEFTITKKIDQASPKFLQALAKGTHIKDVELSVRKAGARNDYLKMNYSGLKTAVSNDLDLVV